MDPEDTFAEDEAIRRMMGTGSFGKQDLAANIEAQIEQSRRKTDSTKPRIKGPEKKISVGDGSDGEGPNDDEDEDDDDDDDSDEDDEFPISHELVLKTHEKPITSLSLDASGGRLASSSTDCTYKLHDFASMTSTTLRAFRTVDPTATKNSAATEAHPVHQVIFNPLAPKQMLVVTAFPQAKLFDRDGEELVEFVKGDMYLRDLNHTKGHISEITSGAWNPTNKDLCVTAGTDSTLRIWDVNNKRSQKDVIVFKSKAAGMAGRTRMTAVAWGSQAQGGQNMLVSAALDGSLVIYGGDGPYHRPVGEVRNAHTADTWTSGIAINNEGRLIVSRGGDDTIKLWDVRKFKAPVSTATHESFSSQYPTANIAFSPNSSNIITGSIDGSLQILNPATLKPEVSTPITPGIPLISVLWHPKLNQILTGSASGAVHILYNPLTSTGGAKLVLSKAPKRRHIDDDPNRTMDLSAGFSGDVITPGHILPPSSSSTTARNPTIGLTASGKSRDPRRPYMPATTPFAKNEPSARHIAEQVPLSSMRDEDPREALLKYADKAKEDPLFTKAWAQTQPKTLYADVEAEEERDKKRRKR
ncbi:WD repeat protein [Microthyrium microscopicum]|uniref:WD repeat protein n=1 Tax=Microthyrium microscopicum TaxID=703497 RepID=A0A6A6UCM6_9PEZI|nr:WD repeat protein [Microthyrium microscopicum]